MLAYGIFGASTTVYGCSRMHLSLRDLGVRRLRFATRRDAFGGSSLVDFDLNAVAIELSEWFQSVQRLTDAGLSSAWRLRVHIAMP